MKEGVSMQQTIGYSSAEFAISGSTYVTLSRFTHVVPWNILSTLVYIGFLLLFSSFVGFIYIWVDTSYEMDRKNKAVSNRVLILPVFSIVVVAVLINMFIMIVWAAFGGDDTIKGIDAVDWAFLMMLGLVGLNMTLPFFFIYFVNKFHKVLPDIYASLIKILFLGLSLLIPYVISGKPIIALIIQGIIFICVLLFGQVMLTYVIRDLETQRRHGPSDTVIQARIERILYQQGRISYANMPEVPYDRFVAALDQYYIDHRDIQSLDRQVASPQTEINQQKQEEELSFVRANTVALVTKRFTDLRIALSNNTSVQNARITEAAARLAETLQQQFGFKAGTPYHLKRNYEKFYVLSTNPALLESILPNPFPLIIFSSQTSMTDKEMEQLQDIQHQCKSRSQFAILIPVSEGREVYEQYRRTQGSLGRATIILDEDACRSILVGVGDTRDAFMRIVGPQIDLNIFNPYNDGAPTTIDMFYGRRNEIASIIEKIDEASTVVIGSRRIGKTSIIKEASRILQTRGKKIYEIDCQHIDSYDSFFESVSYLWDVNLYQVPQDFSKLVGDLQKRDDKDLIFVFDEFDRLLDFDIRQKSSETLLRTFRSMSQEKRCQFILGGERLILERLDHPNSALYNFATALISPGLLDFTITERLVVEPLTLIGVQLDNPKDIADYIYEHTSGHPNLIQVLCGGLIKEANALGKRQISLAMVKQQCRNNDYRQRYFETFLSQSTGFEAAMALCILEQPDMDEALIFDHFKQMGADLSLAAVMRGLRYLSLCHLIAPGAQGYRIKATKFGDSLRLPIDHWRTEFIRRGHRVWRGGDYD
jgi:hypothetical protein